MHTLETLLDSMASRDPQVRDGWAYAELAEGIREGRFALEHSRIQRRAVEYLNHSEVQARAFAPLILTWLLQAEGASAEASPEHRASATAVSEWYIHEPDVRGYDDQLGWLHAVAHGADYLAQAVEAGVMDAGSALTALARRMVADGPQWADQEDARVASAMARALRKGAVTDRPPREWLEVVDAALDAYEVRAERGEGPVRPSMWLRNLTSTLALLYVAISERADAEAPVELRRGVADRVERVAPFLVRPGT